ncbi:hypothetical protein C5D44_07300 [Rathayibacter sp. AY1B5]|nr:hypothetical protein C5D44_07300 [Rathayibacter sp. AY1B5]
MARRGLIRRRSAPSLRGRCASACLGFFHADGSALESPGSDRMVRVSREDLAAVPHAVGVAVGAEKTASIIGAVRGSLIDTPVTDAATVAAAAILATL